MTWHVQTDLLRRYARDDIDVSHAFSIEAHLLSCATCRDETRRVVEASHLARSWERIDEVIVTPRPTLAERLLTRAGLSDHSARLLAATPSLQLSWFLAIAAVLALAVGAAHAAADGYLLFLAVAPLLPLAGVAAAFGPGVDPTYEIGVAAPMRSFRLLLVRATAVLTVTLMLAVAGALLLPGSDWKVAAWLLPSLALVTASLALSTVVRPLRAAACAGGAWLAWVLAGSASTAGPGDLRSVFGELPQLVSLLVAVIGAGVLVARRDRFERAETS
jgi:hypothetical protein